MKPIYSALPFILAASLSACGGGGGNDNSGASSSITTSAPPASVPVLDGGLYGSMRETEPPTAPATTSGPQAMTSMTYMKTNVALGDGFFSTIERDESVSSDSSKPTLVLSQQGWTPVSDTSFAYDVQQPDANTLIFRNPISKARSKTVIVRKDLSGQTLASELPVKDEKGNDVAPQVGTATFPPGTVRVTLEQYTVLDDEYRLHTFYPGMGNGIAYASLPAMRAGTDFNHAGCMTAYPASGFINYALVFRAAEANGASGTMDIYPAKTYVTSPSAWTNLCTVDPAATPVSSAAWQEKTINGTTIMVVTNPSIPGLEMLLDAFAQYGQKLIFSVYNGQVYEGSLTPQGYTAPENSDDTRYYTPATYAIIRQKLNMAFQ
ncbi:hypothetical protein [Paraherbaspirillum soli]|uniref:Lipoprotein n=1 Tax=Paraherbaspirillum soli TaxID=631222 RepID=A0ABW0M8T2_9BURK